MGKKRKWTDDQLIAAVPLEESYYGVLRRLGLKLCGGSHAIVKMRVRQLGLDTSHFRGSGWCHGAKHSKFVKRFVAIPLEEILVKDSTYQNTSLLRKRLVAAGLLENKCYDCGGPPVWNNKPLVMQLDHIDGDRTNHQIENLRLLCPNCHSQTDTWCAKNQARVV